MDLVELLIGLAEISTALAGFTGVVVAFGSRSQGSWHPGDRMRLVFLLEASLTAGGFSILALVIIAVLGQGPTTWNILSGGWAAFMAFSLLSSRSRIRKNQAVHSDIDEHMNRITSALFILLIIAQLINVFFWHRFSPFLAALALNLAGAAMQFSRLIRSAFSG